MIENIKKVSERATWQIFKRSAYWDLRESSERCLVYEQNDWLEWLEWLMLQMHGLRPVDAQKNTSKDCNRGDNNNNNNNNNSSSILCFLGDPELRKSFNWANLRRGNLSRSEQLQVYYLL